MALHETTDATFEADVLKSDIPVLVDFWAPWCGPCRAMAPVLEELGTELAGRMKIVKLNTDDNPVTSAKYGITSIPTMNVFVGGDVAKSIIGAKPKPKLLPDLQQFLG